MRSISRRRMLKSTATAVAAVGLGTAAASAQTDAVNEELRIGLIGTGGRGRSLAGWIRGAKGAKLVAICDADRANLEKCAKELQEKAELEVDPYVEYRELLDRKDIDAVVIATPNHWHALMSIHACQAGKHVYVEKPVCHTIWEGRQLVEAARAEKRVVSSGFQNRSLEGIREAMGRLRSGELGAIKQVRGLCYRRREGIGIRDTPLTPPKTVDYDFWLGPAADLPIMRPRFHYDWHWVYNTGNGDLGNQGPHELDLIRMALGEPGHPKRITSFGGRFGWHDAGNTPNMQCVLYDFGNGIPVIFEVRNLHQQEHPDVGRLKNVPPVGIVVTCEGGEYRGGRGGGAFFDPQGEVVREFHRGGDEVVHMQNFIDAVRDNKPDSLDSPVESAYYSSCLSLLGNIAVRCGDLTSDTDIKHKLLRHGVVGELAAECFGRFSEQLKLWAVDTHETPWQMGSVRFNLDKERFVGGGTATTANSLVRRKDRKPFTVPKYA